MCIVFLFGIPNPSNFLSVPNPPWPLRGHSSTRPRCTTLPLPLLPPSSCPPSRTIRGPSSIRTPMRRGANPRPPSWRRPSLGRYCPQSRCTLINFFPQYISHTMPRSRPSRANPSGASLARRPSSRRPRPPPAPSLVPPSVPPSLVAPPAPSLVPPSLAPSLCPPPCPCAAPRPISTRPLCTSRGPRPPPRAPGRSSAARPLPGRPGRSSGRSAGPPAAPPAARPPQPAHYGECDTANYAPAPTQPTGARLTFVWTGTIAIFSPLQTTR